MYKKAWCSCKVVVLLLKPIVFFTFSSPSASRRQLYLTRVTLNSQRLISLWPSRSLDLKVMLHEVDSQRRFLAQHSVASLLRHCFEWLQHCSDITTLCCAINRRRESSRATSPFKVAYVRCATTHCLLLLSLFLFL